MTQPDLGTFLFGVGSPQSDHGAQIPLGLGKAEHRGTDAKVFIPHGGDMENVDRSRIIHRRHHIFSNQSTRKNH